jgi:hypothetical protein
LRFPLVFGSELVFVSRCHVSYSGLIRFPVGCSVLSVSGLIFVFPCRSCHQWILGPASQAAGLDRFPTAAFIEFLCPRTQRFLHACTVMRSWISLLIVFAALIFAARKGFRLPVLQSRFDLCSRARALRPEFGFAIFCPATVALCLFLIHSRRFDFAALQLWLDLLQVDSQSCF